MNADSRGVRRGGCSTCPCPGYDGGPEKKRCIKCGHPPGKHQNLDNPSAFVGATSSIPNPSPPAGVRHTGYHMAPVPPPQPPPDLPLCSADGCNNKVWYEFGLREDLCAFSYCSPECRDRHLLPIRRHKLQEELEEMKVELQRVAARDSPKMMQRQQSNGQSSQLSGQGHNSRSSASTASVKTSAGNKKVVKEVMIEKKARKPSGLILCKKPYVTDKAENLGFIIVGVVKDTPVYSKLQDDQIRLLDVIETVNGTPCHTLLLPDMDLQGRFEHSIDECKSVKLELNRCIALPPVSRPLSFAKKKTPKFTHVTVLMYSKDCHNDAYGLILDHECKVKGTVTNSPGELSRVKFGDKITVYVVASQDEIREGQLTSDKQLPSMKLDLQAAYQNKNNVILFIKKSEDSSYM